MLVLGLLLLAAAVVAAAEGILANTAPVTVHMWGWTWHFELFWAAVCGAGIIVLALIGLGLARHSTVRSLRMRRDHRALLRENERLAGDAESRKVAQNRAARMPDPEPAKSEPADPLVPEAEGTHAVPDGGGEQRSGPDQVLHRG
ncbi:MAG: LapA family protein [Jatrophihabitans sp.]|nr:MAG: LapA family protein [Jatrophihabitans sp.]